MSSKVTLNHFHPYSLWKVDAKGPTFDGREPMHIIDSRTGDAYLNEDRGIIRFKCALLILGTPFVHAIAALTKMLINLIKIIILFDLWHTPAENKDTKTTPTRLVNLCLTVFHLIFAPIAVGLLMLAAVYGLLMPLDGRKLYATLERFTYGGSILAPCFQPNPDEHFFGGDLAQPNAF